MKIKLGHSKTVYNAKRKFGSHLSYRAVYMNIEGKETALLFSADDIKDARERANKNIEDLPELQVSFWKWFKLLFK